VTEAVIDSSVVFKWLVEEDERHLRQAQTLQHRYDEGALRVFAASHIWLELLNAGVSRYAHTPAAVTEFAQEILRLRFSVREPELGQTARWTAEGLSAYDAAWVAVAEATGLPLITDDDEIVAVAPDVALPLSSVEIRA
jgi:predicted nucleic acid-binding protein